MFSSRTTAGLLLLAGLAPGVAGWAAPPEQAQWRGGKVTSIVDCGAKVNKTDNVTVAANAAAISSCLAAAGPGDTVQVPAGSVFFSLGGIYASGLVNVTFQIEGTLNAVPDLTAWPKDKGGGHYLHFVQFENTTGLTVMASKAARDRGEGVIDGHGQVWWAGFILGTYKEKRPKIMIVEDSRNVLVDGLHLRNSPSFHLQLIDNAHVEVRGVWVEVELREIQTHKAKLRALREGAGSLPSLFNLKGLQPEDLNTDGIDPSGKDYWVHDCVVENDDDSIAVKPCDQNCKSAPCSEDMVFERLTLTGFGASIGSVPPHQNVNCVRNILFRNISMPKTGKGIYVKSNPKCEPGSTGIIANITYEDILITEPRWWPIWIGPQQQHEPGQSLGDKCALDYPIDNHCPTQGCVTFSNITLRRVTVEGGWLSPGVILGNASNPMDVHFESVNVHNPGWFPFEHKYKCEHTNLDIRDSSPIPDCAP